MKLSEKEEKILIDIFNEYHKTKILVKRDRFRIHHDQEIDVIENLIQKKLIDWNVYEETYRVTFSVLILLDNKEINNVFDSTEIIFNKLKYFYKESRENPVNLKKFSEETNLNKSEIIEGILYLQDMVDFGYSADLNVDDASLIPRGHIYDFKDFDTVVYKQKEKWLDLGNEQEEPQKLRHEQLAKLLCQAVAKTLWDENPKMNMTEMAKHHAIQEYAGGKYYSPEKTIRRWVREVAPDHIKNKHGRPKSK